VRFAGAGSADEDRVALGIQEGAARQFADLALVDWRLREHECVEVLEHRELGAPDAVADRSGLPMGSLGPD